MTTEQCLLQDSVIEIRNLRAQNNHMSARLQMFDDLMLMFRTSPAYGGMQMSPDIAREIEKHLESAKQVQNSNQ